MLPIHTDFLVSFLIFNTFLFFFFVLFLLVLDDEVHLVRISGDLPESCSWVVVRFFDFWSPCQEQRIHNAWGFVGVDWRYHRASRPSTRRLIRLYCCCKKPEKSNRSRWVGRLTRKDEKNISSLLSPILEDERRLRAWRRRSWGVGEAYPEK